MRGLMRQAVNRLYACHPKADDPDFFGMLDRPVRETREWDQPEFNEVMQEALEARRRRAQG